MEMLNDLPIYLIAILIFSIRVVDVSIGTLRTVCVVQGRLKLSVILGFFEVLIWIAALSQMLTNVSASPYLVLAYAGGFATGNAVGITLEQKLALGKAVVRMISAKSGHKIAHELRQQEFRVTTFEGQGQEGQVTLIYAICLRRELRQLIQVARNVEPGVFFAVETIQEQPENFAAALPHPTGWRAVFKKK